MAGRTELARRLRAAAVLLALMTGALYADIYLLGCDVGLMVLGAVTLAFAYNEFCNLCEAYGIRPFRVFGMVGCIFLLFLQWATLPTWSFDAAGAGRPLFWGDYEKARAVLDGAAVLVIFVMFLRQAFIKDSRDALPALGMTLLGVIYCWFLPSFAFRIRHLGGRNWLITGHNLLIALIFVSKIADVGAYFFGKKFGRHKLIPRISPAKSIEGAVAGLACSVAMAFALRAIGVLPVLGPGGRLAFGAAETVAFGLLVGGTGMCGDLFESILKRSGGHKDSSRMLPGYGGVLDVVDSVIISAPPAYLFLRMVTGLTMSGAGT
ncbi:MAG: phosphatidate cytidylyltransferase [Planctomycetota bacterium]